MERQAGREGTDARQVNKRAPCETKKHVSKQIRLGGGMEIASSFLGGRAIKGGIHTVEE